MGGSANGLMKAKYEVVRTLVEDTGGRRNVQDL